MIFFKKLSKNKGLEIQLTIKLGFANWFVIALESFSKCDHERIEFRVELLKIMYFHIMIHDFRHWNHELNTYEI